MRQNSLDNRAKKELLVAKRRWQNFAVLPRADNLLMSNGCLFQTLHLNPLRKNAGFSGGETLRNVKGETFDGRSFIFLGGIFPAK